MIPIQNVKCGILTPPQLKDNGAFAGNTYIDTLGYDNLRVLFIVGTLDETIGSGTGGTAALQVQECDTTDGSYTDITGAATADAIAATEDDSLFAIDINLHGCKRYVNVEAPTSADGTTGGNLAVIGILSRGETAPNTATEAGLAEWINV